MKNPLTEGIWTPRKIDSAMLLVVLVNALAATAVGAARGQLDLAAPMACAAVLAAATVVWRLKGSAASRIFLAIALVALTSLQIHLFGGQSVYHLNVLVCMGLLMAYRDWRPIATLGGLGLAHLVLFDQLLRAGWNTHALPAPDGELLAAHVLLLALQTGTLCVLALGQQQQARAASELEFLVKTMGRDGKILLNLDVIRAETPIGQRLQHVQRRMADAMSAVYEAAQRVDIAAQRVSTGSSELRARTTDTASGLRDAAMCLDQINVIVQHSTEASTEAKLMSDSAAGIADRGGQLVDHVVQTMKAIESSSRRITDIIGEIDSIAFQTNILALNAAVEAARAGDQGRGFAVVASEVRNLANRSAAAAKEIKSLISESAGNVASGSQQVALAGETMGNLVGSVRRVGALFEEVTSDTAAHMESLNMVSQSMADLGTITQHNVALAQTTDSAAAELQAMASKLAGVLNGFNLSTGSSRQSASPSLPATAPTRVPPASTKLAAAVPANSSPEVTYF